MDNEYSIYQLNVVRRKTSNICEGHEPGFNVYLLMNSWYTLKVLKKKKYILVCFTEKNVIDIYQLNTIFTNNIKKKANISILLLQTFVHVYYIVLYILTRHFVFSISSACIIFNTQLTSDDLSIIVLLISLFQFISW